MTDQLDGDGKFILVAHKTEVTQNGSKISSSKPSILFNFIEVKEVESRKKMQRGILICSIGR